MKKVVILDAGHGGIDPSTGKYTTPGKRSPIWEDGTQYFEGEGNRDIVMRATQYLKNAGWLVFHTVDPTDHTDLSLRDRINNSNTYFRSYPTAFQISVHSNAFKKNVGKGAEVWTSVGLTESDGMATIYMNEFAKIFPKTVLRAGWRDGDIDKEKNLAMNRVHCPSFLIEPLFHSDEKECRILMSDAGREKLAIVLVETCEAIHKSRK